MTLRPRQLVQWLQQVLGFGCTQLVDLGLRGHCWDPCNLNASERHVDLRGVLVEAADERAAIAID